MQPMQLLASFLVSITLNQEKYQERYQGAGCAGVPEMLTDIALKALKPAPKPYKRSDGGGLFIFVKPNGGKFWSLGCNVNGKQKFFSGGSYRPSACAKLGIGVPLSRPSSCSG